MKIIRAIALVAILLAAATTARAQIMVLPLDGAKLFVQYCAACHGLKATGDGPVAPALRTKVPDLTLIAKRNGGVFPLDQVQTIIAGEKSAGLSHGTREMPIWGPIFSLDISDRDYGKLRVYNVAKYLEGLQKK
jgi:mono/diheme cytochrome c family protein